MKGEVEEMITKCEEATSKAKASLITVSGGRCGGR